MENKAKLLVLLSRIPYPLDKGDKLRAYHQLKGLSKNFSIILVCLNTGKVSKEAIDKLRPYCHHIEIIQLGYLGIALRLLKALFSPLPFQVHYFHSKAAQKQFDKVIDNYTPRRFFCQLIRVTEYTSKYSVFSKTLDYMDALSIGMERRIDKSPFYLKPFVSTEHRRLKQYENKMFQHFEHKVIISKQDQEYIAHQNTHEISVIPNGIDMSYWIPKTNPDKEYELLFTGNMAYPPNVEGAVYIVKEVLPLLLKKNPNIRLLISGKTPVSEVSALASKNVTISGWVDDMRDSYNKSRIFFAPMNLGSGLQNKLLEAMSMKMPCVTSELANRALGAQADVEIMVANQADEYAKLILTLLDDEDKANNLAEKGQQYVHNHFDWSHWNQQLSDLIMQ